MEGYATVMEAADIARKLSGDGRILEVGTGVSHVYRVWDNERTNLVKIYASAGAERREQQAFENLSGLDGLPMVISRGTEGERPWVMFLDPGKWNLSSLPENPSLAAKAGTILRTLHSHSAEHLSNVAHGIDQEWINADFPAVFKRLERYRGRVGLSAEVVERAGESRPPTVTEGVTIHTDPNPEQFFVDDDGRLTLFHWEWSTLGPPEWDYSRLLWLAGIKTGPKAAAGVVEGYGEELPADELRHWAAYHSGMMLIQAVEMTDPQLRGVSWLVDELTKAVS